MTTENTNRGGHPHGDEIDLVELAQNVWAKRKMILRNTAIGAVVGIVVAFSIPKEYKTTVKLAPENSGQSSAAGNMGALAAMAGINLGSVGEDGLTPALYPDIVASTPFILELKDLKVTTLTDQHSFTLYEYLVDYQKKEWWSLILNLPRKIIGSVMSLFLDDHIDSPEVWNPYKLTKKQQSYVNLLSKSIEVSENKKTKIIYLGVTMQDPQIAAQLADTLISKLQLYMTNYKTEKSRNDLLYVDRLCVEAQQKYYDIQKQYAQYEDANKNIISASYAVEKARLQNEVTLAFSIYNSIAQQVEMAKAKVQQDTPILTVLEPSKISIDPVTPNKKVIILGFGFFVLIGTVFFYLIKEIIHRIM